MNYKDFQVMNMGWDSGCCRISDSYAEKQMRKNYEIYRNVKREFYRHYNRNLSVPQKGDVVEFVNNNRLYPHAAVESVDKYGLMYVCEQGSTHTNGKYFSTSGGAWTHIHISHFEFAGYEYRRFWTWGAHGSGAHQGIYFDILVKKWRQKDIPKIVPMHEVCLFSKYYRERCGYKAVVKDYSNMYVFVGFETFKRFKEWAKYVGLTYRKRSDGRYFANQFLKREYFGAIDELPSGCKPIKATVNGSDVRCYVHNDGETITYFCPNPNAKEVYILMEEQVF